MAIAFSPPGARPHSTSRARLWPLTACFLASCSSAGLVHVGTSSSARPRVALSTQGVPGLIDTPVAAIPDARVALAGLAFKRDTAVAPITEETSLGFMFAILPSVMLGARGTVAKWTKSGEIRDGAANLHLLVMDEGPYWPSLALGATDLSGGSVFFRSRYAVASKTFFEVLRASAGFGMGPDLLDGPFGGLELAPLPYVSLLAEYDARDAGVALRVFPLPDEIEALGVPSPSFDLSWTEESGASLQIGLRHTLGEAKHAAQRASRARHRYEARPSPRPLAEAIEALAQELEDRGLEDVRVTLTSSTGGLATIEYENRSYNRDELDAAGVVLGLAATLLPEGVRELRIVVVQDGIATLDLATSREDYLDFLNEVLPEDLYAERVRVATARSSGDPWAAMDSRSSSALKIDVTVTPSVESLVLTDLAPLQARFLAYFAGDVKLTPGLVLGSRLRVPLAQTSSLREALGDPEIDRLLLSQVVRLGFPELPIFAQATVGKLARDLYGAGGEVMLVALGGLLSARGQLDFLGTRFGDFGRTYGVGELEGRWDPWDVTASIAGGVYVDGDKGWRVELGRFFGSTELTLFVHLGDHGSSAGMSVRLPLTPAEELFRPFWIRPRLPDLVEYSARTTILEQSNWVRQRGGRELPSDRGIWSRTLSRGRIHPRAVLEHLERLRDATRFWVEPSYELPN